MIKKNTRAALYLLALGGGKMTKIRHMKLLFLATRENGLYDFVPYKRGPFSFELYNDFRPLVQKGFVQSGDTEWTLESGWVFPKPDQGVQRIFTKIYNEYDDLSDEELIKFVYKKYQNYTVNSERKDKYVISPSTDTGITTIGYEGKNLDAFIFQLIENHIDLLVDVRNNPFSMKYGFNKSQLMKVTQNFQAESFVTKIEYVHIPQLGVESSKRQNLTKDGYNKLFAEYEIALDNKTEYLNKIIELSKTHKIALMCFEADVNCCHRGIIAKRLIEMGCPVENI
jgi:hypothetical protein